MGKKGKKKRSDLKKMKKMAIKKANRARYDSMRDSGNNSKRNKRKKKKSGNKGSEKNKHLVSNCGNIGCQKCNPRVKVKEIFISVRELLKLVKLSPVNKQLPGGSQTKKLRGGAKLAA